MSQHGVFQWSIRSDGVVCYPPVIAEDEDGQRFIPPTALILTNSAPIDPLKAMFIYRQKAFPR
jgi:hypothetical protein